MHNPDSVCQLLHHNCVNSAESLEDALYDLNETRVNEEIKVIEDEIDTYKKLTDAQIEALDAEKDKKRLLL